MLRAYGDDDVTWDTTWSNDDEFLINIRHSHFRGALLTLDREYLRYQRGHGVASDLISWFRKHVPSAQFFLSYERPETQEQRYLWMGTFTLEARLEHIQPNVRRWRMADALPGTLALTIRIEGNVASVRFFFQSQQHLAKLVPTPEDVEVVTEPWAREPRLSVPVYHRAL